MPCGVRAPLRGGFLLSMFHSGGLRCVLLQEGNFVSDARWIEVEDDFDNAAEHLVYGG